MSQFFRILLFSPRLTVAVCLMLFGAIGGTVTKSRSDERKPHNAWSKENSGGYYTAQKRADDGWGGQTRASNARDNVGSGRTTEQVWVNKDGVIYEQEDVKALDRSEYE
ncbi:MAG: hypothetical protein ACKOPG_01850 [Novosphingobium sp.]